MKENFKQNENTTEAIKKIKIFMFENNFYQSDMAKRLGISQAFLNLVINGKANFSERTIFNIDKYIENYENKDN